MENVENKDFTVYITKLYRTIPKNCALIVRNKFNGSKVECKMGGFALIAPWKESKLVSLAIQNINYEKASFDDKEGQQLTVDLALSIKVVDPIKYEYVHKNPEEELKILLYSLVRVLIKKSSYEELSKKHFELPNSNIEDDPNILYTNGGYIYKSSIRQNSNGNSVGTVVSDFDLELYDIRKQLNLFASKYGLAVVSLRNQEVQQSEEMQKAYDEKIEQERKGMAAQEAARQRQAKVQIETKTRKMEAENQAEVLKIKLKAILEATKGMPIEAQERIINTYLINEKGSTPIFFSDNSMTAKTGAVAGVTSNIVSDLESKQKSK